LNISIPSYIIQTGWRLFEVARFNFGRSSEIANRSIVTPLDAARLVFEIFKIIWFAQTQRIQTTVTPVFVDVSTSRDVLSEGEEIVDDLGVRSLIADLEDIFDSQSFQRFVHGSDSFCILVILKYNIF
jgi:hypothetical protein